MPLGGMSTPSPVRDFPPPVHLEQSLLEENPEGFREPARLSARLMNHPAAVQDFSETIPLVLLPFAPVNKVIDHP